MPVLPGLPGLAMSRVPGAAALLTCPGDAAAAVAKSLSRYSDLDTRTKQGPAWGGKTANTQVRLDSDAELGETLLNILDESGVCQKL